MLSSITEDCSNALRDHSSYSIGRLHQALLQLLQTSSSSGGGLGSIMSLPESFIRSIHAFVKAKLDATPKLRLRYKLEKLCSKSKNYLSQLPLDSSSTAERSRLEAFVARSDISSHGVTAGGETTGDNGTNKDLLSMSSALYDLVHAADTLRPQGFELMMGCPVADRDQEGELIIRRVTYLPCISLESFYDISKLDELASLYSESLTMDVINIGSLLGFKIGPSDPSLGAAMITSLLNAGFAYVTGK
jgi:hypothetical protein